MLMLGLYLSLQFKACINTLFIVHNHGGVGLLASIKNFNYVLKIWRRLWTSIFDTLV